MKLFRAWHTLAVGMLLCLVLSSGASARAQGDPRMFGQTGYRIDEDAFWDYFRGRGEETTFGFPASRAFRFLGCSTQFFQRLVMQRCGGGGVGTLNLLDEGLLPYTTFNGSVVPGPDPSLKNATPRPDSPDYGAAILDFVRTNAPDAFDGQPVKFQTTFLTAISPARAGTSDPNIIGLLDLELWGAPTSRPAHDPSNSDFIYQRFQRGIMHYDKNCGCTRGLLLADYLKGVITGQNVPADLAEQARSSPLFESAVNGRVPSGTDYTGAFIGVPDSQPTAPAPTSTPQTPSPGVTSTPVPQPDSLLGRKKEDAPGQVQGALAFTEPRGSERCSRPDQSGQLQIDVRPDLTRAYPDVFMVCLISVASQQDVRVNSSPGGRNVSLPANSWASGARWPPDGPTGPGTYTLSAQQGTQPNVQTDTRTVTVTDAMQQRVLVFPRRGAPGTTFDVYLGGFPKNQSAVLRVYRCDNQPRGGNGLACQDNEKRVYVTSLPPIAVDGAGRAKTQLRSLSSDPKTEFALLSDDMVKRVQQSGIITDDGDGVGKAWFCTASAPTCTTERD